MRKSVLIVDDEKNIRSTLSDILAREGFEVHMAESAEKALKLCGRQVFDAILMDVRMPGMDGVEAFRRIKRRWRDTHVIMMSGYSMEELEKAALREGALAFLRKPLDIRRVVQLLDEVERRPRETACN